MCVVKELKILCGWMTRVQFLAGAGKGYFSFTGSRAHPVGNRGLFSQGLKHPGRKADHSPTCSAEFKNAWNYKSTSPYVVLR
jgi:hypothetical protein